MSVEERVSQLQAYLVEKERLTEKVSALRQGLAEAETELRQLDESIAQLLGLTVVTAPAPSRSRGSASVAKLGYRFYQVNKKGLKLIQEEPSRAAWYFCKGQFGAEDVRKVLEDAIQSEPGKDTYELHLGEFTFYAEKVTAE